MRHLFIKRVLCELVDWTFFYKRPVLKQQTIEIYSFLLHLKCSSLMMYWMMEPLKLSLLPLVLFKSFN